MEAKDIKLVETCCACPEQYDAVCMGSGEVVGYLRLRHGRFTVEVPGPGGELVFEAYPEGDGMFAADERERYLSLARERVAGAYRG